MKTEGWGSIQEWGCIEADTAFAILAVLPRSSDDPKKKYIEENL